MANGIRIAKRGYDVNDGEKNMYVDSDTPLLKIFNIYRGYIKYRKATDNFQLKNLVRHNLGYTPAYLLFVERNVGSNQELVTFTDTAYNDTLVGGAGTVLVNAKPNDYTIDVALSGNTDGDYAYTCIVFYDEILPDA